jgi:hypothetical protein
MPRIVTAVLVFLCFVSTDTAAQPSSILEKKFAFPSPVQWRSGNWEVSLIGAAWGPANSPDMISKGHEERFSGKPEFFPDRSYALALELRGYAPNNPASVMWGGSGLILIKNVNGDLQVPLELTPTGFVRFSGSPGTMDLSFNHTDTTEVWDFFPVSPHQKAFLFQSFAFSPIQSSRDRPRASFKVLIRHSDLVIVNALPGSQTLCPDFTKSFSGTVGPNTQVSLRLTAQGTTLSGTEQYARIGKTLWLRGRVDSLGNFSIQERYPEDHLTGIFKGTFSDSSNAMTGYFSKPDGSRLLPFEFHEAKSSK